MALQALPVEAFGGLNMTTDPTQVGWTAAVDLQNVDLRSPGQMRVRPGVTPFATSAGVHDVFTYSSFLPSGGLVRMLTAGTDGKVRAYDETGALLATSGAAAINTDGLFSCASYGIFAYFTTHQLGGAPAVGKFDAQTNSFSTIGTAPDASFIARVPWSSRMAYAGSGVGFPQRVTFSDPDAPETFTTGNYVTLPGGEGITGMIAWRELLFVFRPSKFHIFNSENADPITPTLTDFNYRTVDTGVGAGLTGSIGTGAAICAAPDGVYFVHSTGIYRTTGGEPEEVSQAIRPLFVASTSQANVKPGYTGIGAPSPTGITQSAMVWRQGVLYARFDRSMLVRTDSGQWSVWIYPEAGGLALLPRTNLSSHPQQLLVPFQTTGSVMVPGEDTVAPGDTVWTDNGTAIVSWYQSGVYSPSGASSETTIRETEFTGVGSVNASWSVNFQDPSASQSIVMGTDPRPGRGYHRQAVAGENLSWRVDSSSGYWSMQRVCPLARERRGAALSGPS